MRLLMRLPHLPGRLAAGAFILNSGLDMRNADRQTAEATYGMAKNAYPFLGRLDPETFVKMLSTAEIALGTALLLPIVPSVPAGAALTGFSGGLLGMYARTPGMTKEGGVLPTEQGIALAKDVWLAGIGLSLVLDDLTRRD